MENTINASLACAFFRYQRQQVTEYLAWQAEIVREYAQPHQFVTHNFDFEWRGYSYGVQPRVDHFAAAQALDIARRYLSPESGAPDRTGNRLWRRHHPLA